MALTESVLGKFQGKLSSTNFRIRRNEKNELGKLRIPTDPKSTAQLDVRAGYSRLADLWRSETWIDKSIYESLAAGDFSGWNEWIRAHIPYMRYVPRLYIGLGEGTGSILHDYSSYENDTDSWNGAWSGNDLDNYISMNGTDQYGNIPTSSSLNFGLDDSFTLQADIRAYKKSGAQQILMKIDSTDPNWLGYHFTILSSGKLRFMVHDTTKPGGSNPALIDGNTDIRDEKWHTIKAVRDVSLDELRLYIDEVQDATPTQDNTTLSSANTVDLKIGTKWTALSQFLKADLRNILIADRVI